MPTSLYRDRLTPGTATVHYLLDLEVAGHVFRVADEALEVVHEDGTTLQYGEGLDVDYETQLALLSDSAGDVSVPVALVLTGVDWADRVARGYDLAAGRATLSRWAEGTTYGARQLLVEGAVSSPTFGALNEPLAFSIVSQPINDHATFPPTDAVVDETTWPYRHPDADGAVYPSVFGCPGWMDAAPVSGSVPGSPALCVDQRTDTWLVAGHRVRAASVWWRNIADPISVWLKATVSHTTDGLGRQVAVVSGLEANLDPDYPRDVWLSWAPLARGVIRVPPQAALNDNETFTISDGDTSYVFEFNVSGAAVITNIEVDVSGSTTPADVRAVMVDAINGNGTLRAVLGRVSTSLIADVWIINTKPGSAGNVAITDTVLSGTWDITYGMEGGLDADERGGMQGLNSGLALEGAGELLQYMLAQGTLPIDVQAFASVRSTLDALVRCSGYIDEPVVPLDWVRAHLLELLPVSLIVGPGGVRPIVWDTVDVASKVVVALDADQLQIERSSSVELGAVEDLVNDVSLTWCLDAARDTYQRTTSLSGSSSSATWACRTSFARYGSLQRVVESDLVYDGASAAAVVGWMTSALALPSMRVSYTALPDRVVSLLPGDVVTISDAEMHWAAKLFHVTGLRDSGDAVELTLRSIEGMV